MALAVCPGVLSAGVAKSIDHGHIKVDEPGPSDMKQDDELSNASHIGRSIETQEIVFKLEKAGAYVLEISWLFAPPSRPYQTLHLVLDGCPIGEVRVDRLCAVHFFAPDPGTLTIRLPDARRPVDVEMGPDTRTLSIGISAFERSPLFEPFVGVRLSARRSDLLLEDLGLQRSKVAMNVESLGDNCELGMVQRELGSEPLGLFRFTSTTPETLVSALEGGLEGLGKKDSLRLSLLGDQNEYMVHDDNYGLLYHTWLFARDVSPEQVLQREYVRLPFLARKFLDEAIAGDKAFVYRDHSGMSSAAEARLFAALRKLGQNNNLLVVRSADGGHPPNTFEARVNRPCRAWIDYKGPDWWMIADTWIATLASVARLQAGVLPMSVG